MQNIVQVRHDFELHKAVYFHLNPVISFIDKNTTLKWEKNFELEFEIMRCFNHGICEWSEIFWTNQEIPDVWKYIFSNTRRSDSTDETI